MTSPTIHASAVLTGATAVLIRGPSGSGKSRLALALIETAARGGLRFARLVADDRCHVEAAGGRLLVRPAERLAGLIEVRGFGIRRLPYEPAAQVGLLADLAAEDARRLPEQGSTSADICGIPVRRVALPAGADPLPVVLSALKAGPGGI